MSILTKFLNTLKTVGNVTPKTCYFCKRKASGMRVFRVSRNRLISVCPLCTEYANRRAFRR